LLVASFFFLIFPEKILRTDLNILLFFKVIRNILYPVNRERESVREIRIKVNFFFRQVFHYE